jgi:hypothetical protein
MNLVTRVRRFSAGLAAIAVLAITIPASAQEISETHVRAARAALNAINATDQFDMVLPQAAQALKTELIQKDPHLQNLIIATVDEKALTLAGRRADLEREAALAYARVFSEDELKEVAAFYDSETGKKLLSDGPIVTREVFRAADIWQRGIARDLAEAVAETLQASASQQTPQQGAVGGIQQPVTESSQ